ncbi:uncharacterized protein LOC107414639 [Ziziphus jujuba]|uniref:Uncharacterized protein LOC107414639 n=1 Tax=Ziziphus jujuba TaxID=326968 RepID=A0A6P3ZS55_ZIZJJ|nr:uncharacterized protein LOC107414639 [Ziziphus jujuba]
MDMEGLSVICAGIGIAEEDENGNRIGYSKGEYCLDNLKDLLRFLRRDDPQNRDVFKQVCKWNIVYKDLIPIMEHCQDDRNLVLNAVKILVFLTMPVEPSSNDVSQQIEYLWGLKSSITCSNIVAVIVSLLEGPLENLEREAFTEDDWKLVQLVLTLFRNILAIQEISLQQKVGGVASQFLSLRDRFLELLFHENVMDLILVITQHFGGSGSYLRHDNLLLLEIFYYTFMGQEPELIAKAHLRGSKVDEDTKASLNSLKSIMEEEEEKRRLCRLRNLGRYSHFSGTFTRLTMDGSKAVLKGKPTSASRDNLLKPHKVSHGRTKKIAWDHGILPSTKDKILELLHDFVNQFLSGGYCVLMQSIREDIEKEHHAIQKSDVVVFFQVAQFVTSFQYHKFSTSKGNMGADASEAPSETHPDKTFFGGDLCGPIASTMNESMFQLVILKWRDAFEGLKETHDYKFLSASASLMKIMICMLDLVLKLLPEDFKEPQTARILLYKLFYDQTDQGMTQFLLNLLKSFDTHKQPKSYLADLIEIIYKILRLMENLQARGTLRVSKKLRRVRKKKDSSDKAKEIDTLGEHPTVQNETSISCAEPSAEMSNANQGILDTSSHEKQDISIPSHADESEMLMMEKDNTGVSLPQKMDIKNSGFANDDLNGAGDSSGDEQVATTDEVDFKVSTLVSAFANNSIIQRLCWLLKFYKNNSTTTNHYIISMLKRISDDLELSPMLYQLSLLTIFYDILDEQKSCPCKEYANIVDFLTTLVRKMLKKMKNQPLLFVEILFWKTRKECHYINAEYLLHELGHMKKESRNWENSTGDGVIGSSRAKEWTRRSIADALGEDEADVVIDELRNDNDEENIGKVKGGMASTSDNEFDVEENCDNGGKSMDHEPEMVTKKKRRLVLGSELDGKIKHLYYKFKNEQNCIRLIAKEVDPDGKVSPAQISNRLKQLGLKPATRKRMRHTDEPDADERAEKAVHSNDLEESLSSRPVNGRKRIRASGEAEEAKIRALYEQFKDHMKCNHMIANALDEDGKFTASQVSRKLKQLGLRVPRQKKLETSIQLRDEDLNDFSMDKSNESDDETLLSLINRRKKREDSNREVEEQTAREDDSDDKILSSVLKSLSKSKDAKHKAVSTQGTVNDNDFKNGSRDVVEERDVSKQSRVLERAEIGEGIAFNHISPNDSREAEVTGNGSGSTLGDLPVNNLYDLPHQQVDDELADFEDEVDYSGVSNSTASRRKLRMVLDVDDDDDD